MVNIVQLQTTDEVMSEHRFFLKFNLSERNIIRHAMKLYAEQFIDKSAEVVEIEMREEGMYRINKEPIYDLKWHMV